MNQSDAKQVWISGFLGAVIGATISGHYVGDFWLTLMGGVVGMCFGFCLCDPKMVLEEIIKVITVSVVIFSISWAALDMSIPLPKLQIKKQWYHFLDKLFDFGKWTMVRLWIILLVFTGPSLICATISFYFSPYIRDYPILLIMMTTIISVITVLISGIIYWERPIRLMNRNHKISIFPLLRFVAHKMGIKDGDQPFNLLINEKIQWGVEWQVKNKVLNWNSVWQLALFSFIVCCYPLLAIINIIVVCIDVPLMIALELASAKRTAAMLGAFIGWCLCVGFGDGAIVSIFLYSSIGATIGLAIFCLRCWLDDLTLIDEVIA